MGMNRDISKEIAGICIVATFVLLFLGAVNLLGSLPQSTAPSQSAAHELDRADLLRLLDCATRPDQLLALQPKFYGSDAFHVRYVYPVLPGREANMLDVLAPTNWL
jgi:hypothetical protein